MWNLYLTFTFTFLLLPCYGRTTVMMVSCNWYCYCCYCCLFVVDVDDDDVLLLAAAVAAVAAAYIGRNITCTLPYLR